MLRDTFVNFSQNYRQDELYFISNLKKLTCIQDIAMSPARSSVVSMIPNQNTARTRNIVYHSVHFLKTVLPLWDPIFVRLCSGYLNMFAVMSSCWKLYSPEGDRTFEGYLNGCLLHAILSIERCIAWWCCYAAEVPLDCDAEEEK